MGGFSMQAWTTSVIDRHNEQVVEGLHDGDCEWSSSGFWICHCRKRRRMAAGLLTPPTEDLYFPPPSCTNCRKELEHDGDGWQCSSCSLSWSSNGQETTR